MTSALQLIARCDGRYYVPEVSQRLLQELPQEPFGVLTICGRYRTGKSTLMNLLTQRLNEPGSFQVGCTTKACTQGLWLYPEPVCFGPTPCFLIDTEGMASMDASANEDAQLLTLALLLSTVFLFNSTGCIDEPSLSTLGTTASLASQMLGGEKPDCALVWVLRDVTLQLRDSRGRLCSGDCYLETSLSGRKGDADLRRCLEDTFRSRRLVPLIRPCVDETSLQNGPALEDMRPEFLSQIDQLRTLLGEVVQTKKGPGMDFLTPQALGFLAEGFARRLTARELPTIRDSFGWLEEAYFTRYAEEAMAALAAISTELPLLPEELTSQLRLRLPPWPHGSLFASKLEAFQTQLLQDPRWTKLNKQAQTKLVQSLPKPSPEDPWMGYEELLQLIPRLDASQVYQACSLLVPLFVEAHLAKQTQELEELRLQQLQSQQSESLTKEQEEALTALRQEHCELQAVHSSEMAALRMELDEAQHLLKESEEQAPSFSPNSHLQCEALRENLERKLRLEEATCSAEREQREEDARRHREELQRAVAEIMSDAGSSLAQLRGSLHNSEARHAEAEVAAQTLQEELHVQRETCEELRQRHRDQLAQQTCQYKQRLERDALETQRERTRAFGLEREAGRAEAECAVYRRRCEQVAAEQSESKRQRLELCEAREGLAGVRATVDQLREQLNEALAREQKSKQQERQLLGELQAQRRAHVFAEVRLEMLQERGTERPRALPSHP